MTIESREIIERLRLKMPLLVQLPDPVTGEPFTINRDNILALLVIDLSNLHFEAQIVAALYAEAGRIRAAAHKVYQESQVRYRKWQASKRAECRAKAEKAKLKKPSKEEQEDYYRQHSEYQGVYQEQIDMSVLVSVADDLKKAFDMKSRQLLGLSNETFGHDKMQNASDRLMEMEIERLSQESAAAAADFRERGQPPVIEVSAEDSPEEDSPAEDESVTTSPPATQDKPKKGGKRPRPLKRGKGK